MIVMNADRKKQEVQDADDRRVSALLAKDYGAFARLLSDALVYHHASGKVDTKESYLAQFLDGKVTFIAAERKDVSIDVIGDTAVCRGIAHNELIVGGAPFSGQSRYFSVWARGADGWVMVAWSSVKAD
jgi:ketosteroid isomerase-like protein